MAGHTVIPLEQYHSARDYLRSCLPANTTPTVGVVCGSGLGKLYQLLSSPVTVNYEDIPGFVKSTVAGHEGKLVFGHLGNQYVVCMVGRFHPYEGYSPQQVTFPIRVMTLLGIRLLIVTNAAGGLNESYSVGDLMVFEDFVGLFHPGATSNPLIGSNEPSFGPRFPPTSDAFPKPVRAHAFRTAHKLGFLNKVHSGIYCFVSGPQYETRAECRLLRSAGGDAVGMSTVPEIVVARHAGVPVLGVSLITNKVVARREESVKAEVEREIANGGAKHEPAPVVKEDKANHEEVLKASQDYAQDVLSLIKHIVEDLHTVEGFHQ
ncbi:Purine nucleoside phosphorylase [Blastocladiella emersonii ATCC 22665]|nr:Purine nucleoside phosphorylase [Blastocladiella emersonii ATCC 22665]